VPESVYLNGKKMIASALNTQAIDEIAIRIRKDLQQNSDPKTLLQSQHFFKEAITVYGVKSSIVHAISNTYIKEIKQLTKAQVFNLCDQLWESVYLEETFIACNFSFALHKNYEPADFAVFEKWINRNVTNWASCDTLCNHTVGAFIEMYPDYLYELKRLASSENRWMRRAAAVSLIVPARRGLFLSDILEIADILLTDHDDMVQKGYGWMLKVASQTHQKEVFDYVIFKKAFMPRTALRYAIEKMPAELKSLAMAR
jgi:3-methyladenine DNA glycosylase AlkD